MDTKFDGGIDPDKISDEFQGQVYLKNVIFKVPGRINSIDSFVMS